MQRVAKSVTDGNVKVVIDTVYFFEDGLKAIKHVNSGRVKGKVVITLV